MPGHPMNEDVVTTRALNEERILVKRCYHYLSGLPFVLWADWDISIPAQRLKAARWLAQQYENVTADFPQHSLASSRIKPEWTDQQGCV